MTLALLCSCVDWHCHGQLLGDTSISWEVARAMPSYRIGSSLSNGGIVNQGYHRRHRLRQCLSRVDSYAVSPILAKRLSDFLATTRSCPSTAPRSPPE